MVENNGVRFMHRNIFTFLIFLAFSALLAQSLEITDFQRVDSDLSARVTAPKMDNYGKPMALLKISTALTGVSVTGTGYCEVEAHTGELWVFVNEGTFNIKVAVKGYERLVYPLPETAKSAIVYRMKLRGEKVADQIPVSFITKPEDAEKWLDGELLGTEDSYSVARGEHTIEIRMHGYEPYRATIQVDEKNPLFKDIVLVEQLPVMFTVSSEPQGVKLFINGSMEGYTNMQPIRLPGKYTLRLEMDNYQTIEDTITLSNESENQFHYRMLKSTCSVEFQVEPLNAQLILNGKHIVGHRHELAPGVYRLEVRRDGYESLKRILDISNCGNETVDIALRQHAGNLQITVSPMDATTDLRCDGYTVNEFTGSKMVTDLPAGEYELTVSCPGWKTKKFTYLVEDQQTTMAHIVLKHGWDFQDYTSSSGVEMVAVEGGSFMMGSNENEDEQPVHQVTVSSFWMGRYEVTEEQKENLMPTGYGIQNGERYPAYFNWFSAVKFCNRLSEIEGMKPCYIIDESQSDPNNTGSDRFEKTLVVCDFSADGYRLPTETEWEYAARGGNKSKGYFYAGSNNLADVGHYKPRNETLVYSVGTLKPNVLKLYDMSGNASEWCWDWYGRYPTGKQTDPVGPKQGGYRVVRGGMVEREAKACRATSRSYDVPEGVINGQCNGGLRLCRTAITSSKSRTKEKHESIEPTTSKTTRELGKTPKFNLYEDPPMPIKQVKPVYSDFAKRMNITGQVTLEVEIFDDGTVGAVNVVQSLMTGPDGLDQAAVDCVKQWKFKPAQSGGKPVSVWVQFPITFGMK